MAIYEKHVLKYNKTYTDNETGQVMEWKYYRLGECPICGKREQSCFRIELNGETYGISCKFEVSDTVKETPVGTRYIHNHKNYKDFLNVVRLPKVTVPSVCEDVTPDVLNLRHKVYSAYKELIKEYKNKYLTGQLAQLKKYLGEGKKKEQLFLSKPEIEDLYILYFEKKIPIETLLGMYLYPHDLLHLLDRGLNLKQIERMGFFSLLRDEKTSFNGINMNISTAVIRRLQNRFKIDDLLKVPGFDKRESDNGSEYVYIKVYKKDHLKDTPVRMEGFYIPYFDYRTFMNEPKYPAMQQRLTEQIFDDSGKSQRYFWFSSGRNSSGSPISFYNPTDVSPSKEDVLLITEGDLKMKIACEILKVRGAAMAGVTNYSRLIHDVQELEKLEGRKLKILLCFDADKIENSQVLAAEKQTILQFKKAGNPITIGMWPINMAKGIDDLLIQGYQPKYKTF